MYSIYIDLVLSAGVDFSICGCWVTKQLWGKIKYTTFVQLNDPKMIKSISS